MAGHRHQLELGMIIVEAGFAGHRHQLELAGFAGHRHQLELGIIIVEAGFVQLLPNDFGFASDCSLGTW